MANMQKSILITGCSSGIGLSTAEILHKKGYRVFASARQDDDIHLLQSKGLETVKLDLNDSQSIQHAVNTILEKTDGKLYAVFNNAGYMLPGAIEDLSRDMIRSQFETNVFGQMELTNLILPVMRKQQSGRIIFNTSMLGIVTMPLRGAYNASKFALEAFAQTLRQELHGTNIFVSIIAPGPVVSELRHKAYVQYKKTIRGKKSIFTNQYDLMEKNYLQTDESKAPFAKAPNIIADKLIKILENKHPRIRYYIGFPAQLFAMLRRILPEFLLDKIILRVMKEE